MLEVVFSDSACGALKMAQSFGQGKYSSGCIGILLEHADGSEPTKEEIEKARKDFEDEQRRKWEQAVPLGGRACDVFGFSLKLSFGDIQDPLCVHDRLEAFRVLFSFWNEDIRADVIQMVSEVPDALDSVITRISQGEDVRIWYSDLPDELCGFYWFMDQLRKLPEGHGTIYAIKQPLYYESENVIKCYYGWGEVEPGDFYRFVNLAKPISNFMCRLYGNQWQQLQTENTLLRACVNGRLTSVPENLYDYYILKEIAEQPSQFQEALVVGNVLGKYCQGISDGFIHYRIEKMVADGKLIAETVPKKDDPGYWRVLRKS